jgi:eukaryotic-like serine/threonine-protein kinase
VIEPQTLIDGRYRTISRLGSGGMADVYLAQDTLLGREVAVKVLHHHFAEDQEFVERFRREASSAAALSHPNIVAIFDRGEWNGTYYIAMEYVAGRSLKTIVREHGALEPVQAIDIVIQVARAARFAHRRGVIHRDLKPHNVILDDEGRARVTDFGIARAGASDMTLTGSIMGTAQYLSPEQAQGLAVSAASDLYSIGVILYELLTGVVPFEGETAVAIAFKQVSAEPHPPSTIRPGLPPSLDAIVMRALAKDPARRYADADELIAALEAERHALPALSGATASGGLPPHTGAHVQHAPHPPPHTGALLLAQPGVLYDGPAEPPEEPRRGRRRALLWAAAIVLVAGAAIAAALALGGRSSKTVTVPSVTGQPEGAALSALRAAGLNPDSSLATNATVPRGEVVSQAPAAGSSAKKGARVQIVVSSGPASAPLIDVAGLSAAAAEAKLHRAHYRTRTKAQSSKTVPAGQVIATEPPAETELQEGKTVTLLVSSGPAPVRVPDLVGETRQAAEATLKNAELAVGQVAKQPSTQPVGTVLSQSPAAGSSLASGEKVGFTISKAPKEVEVPSVVGAAEAAAIAALERAGLKVGKSSRASTEASQVGSVLEQLPASGSHVHRGATVTIVVGAAVTPTTTTTTTTTTTGTTTASPPPPGSPPGPGQ